MLIAISQCHPVQWAMIGCGTELMEIVIKSLYKHEEKIKAEKVL